MLSKKKKILVRGKFRGVQSYYLEKYESEKLTDEQIKVMMDAEYNRQVKAARIMSDGNRKKGP